MPRLDVATVMPRLDVASVSAAKFGFQPTNKFLRSLSSVRCLDLALKEVACCSAINFPRLIEFMLRTYYSDNWLKPLMLLLHNAPKLKALKITSCSCEIPDGYEDEKSNPEKSVWDFLDKSLQLHKAPSLESLRINLGQQCPVDVDVGKWVLNAVDRFVRELILQIRFIPTLTYTDLASRDSIDESDRSLVSDSPGLNYVYIFDTGGDDCTIQNMPHLDVAILLVGSYPTNKFLRSLSSVRCLDLSLNEVACCSAINFPRLIEFKLHTGFSDNWLEPFMLLLHNAPKLKALMITSWIAFDDVCYHVQVTVKNPNLLLLVVSLPNPPPEAMSFDGLPLGAIEASQRSTMAITISLSVEHFVFSFITCT
ncbi:hypothetical protein ARALYDRAFT_897266 [Arabidopsis lyrata subsp. lyrata]|uniref:FBD domain-containing protein n=1 Tax=Arabidopsis lyrata subsp. lyrata TaxID=81972 RepID=D7L9Q3_ARALL|nr:hypothetical protein ARALYDRAFT_897266 [Arabidopsis lyrata subsp. lyrata]